MCTGRFHIIERFTVIQENLITVTYNLPVLHDLIENM